MTHQQRLKAIKDLDNDVRETQEEVRDKLRQAGMIVR